MKTVLRTPAVIAGLVIWMAVVAAGSYYRFVDQPRRLQAVVQEQHVRDQSAGEVVKQHAEAVLSAEMADVAWYRWSAQHKVLPDTLETTDVVERLNRLTPSGFESFDIAFEGVQQEAGHGYITYSVKGTGYFSSLYRFVWHIENDRQLYRIRGLALDHIDVLKRDRGSDAERLKVMVSFEMQVDAFYGGAEPFGLPRHLAHRAVAEGLGELPANLLPAKTPAMNPFYPLVMEALPPNTHGHVDVESARLLAIVGNEAIFDDGQKMWTLRVGSPVYLGQITHIDVERGQVRARLNKGGILDEVVRGMAQTAASPTSAGLARVTPTALAP